jgi:hypothetical protein
VIGLGAGEPDFDTPDFIKEAAIKAIHAGLHQVHPGGRHGRPEKSHHRQVPARQRLSYEPKQILVSCGGKQSFYNLAQALLNRGDEVIIPAPYWVSYPDMVLLADGVPVIVEAGIEQGFKITPRSWKRPSPRAPNCWSSTARPTRPAPPTARGAGRAGRGAAPPSAGLHRHRRHVRAHPMDRREVLITSSTSARICTTAPSF